MPLFIFLFSISLSFSKDLSFPKKSIVFDNGVTLTVEVAETSEQRAKGLMFRESLAKEQGMLFIFSTPQPMAFWMKNTFIPLSIGFFDQQRRLFQIQDMEPVLGPVRDEDLVNYPSSKAGLYALEVNKGWFLDHKIKLGSRFSFSKNKK